LLHLNTTVAISVFIDSVKRLGNQKFHIRREQQLALHIAAKAEGLDVLGVVHLKLLNDSGSGKNLRHRPLLLLLASRKCENCLLCINIVRARGKEY
jgi:hypothetical protein